jgi:serine phosphatase RsbU (regulator of sigma subunit)
MPQPEDDAAEPTSILTRERLLEALAAHDDTAHYLVAVGGTEPGKHVEIGAAVVTIGRDPRKVLSFNDADLSRFHLQVSLRGGGQVVAEDMGSRNGTFVNSQRVTAPLTLQHGDLLRAGRQVLRYERRSRRDVERDRRLADGLRVASSYVCALLPEPLTSGPVQTTWHFVPSLQLGGDGFGYRWLDASTFVFYLIDVSGHGAGSAMHSVTVLNLLRQRALPGVDVENPADVLTSLNARFPMEQHGGLFFTMWYGVYRTTDRSLRYGSAGHHPAYLVPADRSVAQPLGTDALMIGGMDDTVYQTRQSTVPPGSSIYLFSDGAFEVDTKDGGMWGLKDFVPLLVQPVRPDVSEPVRLYRTVAAAAIRDPLADDFSIVVLTFD